MTMWPVWLAGLGAVLALMALAWLASLARRDVSLVDRVWGLAFVVVTWTYAVVAGAWTARSWLVVILVTVWGLRLSIYLTWRNWGEGEDKRYVRMRERDPDRFPYRSLVTVFALQGTIAWVVSLPLLAATASSARQSLTWVDVVGVVVWVVGFGFQAGGDWQLSRFLVDPANRRKVMDQGLWRYTRHPNYFGDTVIWWSYLILALPTGALWAVVGPVLMSLLIVKVSGVALTDRNMASSKRDGYDEYVRRTNAFFPGPSSAV